MRFLKPVIVLVSLLLLGGCAGYFVGQWTAFDSRQPAVMPHLKQRPFDHKLWIGEGMTNNEKVQARCSMVDSVLAKFKPGTPLSEFLLALGQPDGTDSLDDLGSEPFERREFGKDGKLALEYVVDYLDDSFGPLKDNSWPDVIRFFFTADGRLIRAKHEAGA